MHWIEMLRSETLSLLAHEGDIVPTLERIRTQADGAPVHELLLRMIEAAPSRQGRMEIVCSFAGSGAERHPTKALTGWEKDVDVLLDHDPKGLVVDAAILSLVLKIARLRTAGYETACLLAENLEARQVANLLRPLWAQDRESDGRTAAMLASLVRDGNPGWDDSFGLGQDG